MTNRERDPDLQKLGDTKTVSAGIAFAEMRNTSQIAVPWFDIPEFLAVLQKNINVYKNPATFSVSCKDGHVYFTPNLIYECFEGLARGRNEAEETLYGSDRKGLLIFISDVMREHGVIASQYVKSGYHSARFDTVFGEERRVIFFAPYRAEAFININLRHLELDKSTKIKGIKVMKLHI